MTRFVGSMLLVSVVAGCSSSTGPQHLSFEGRSTVSQTAPMTVQTVVTVRNTGDKTTQIEVSTCPRAVEVFTTPERTGTPVWKAYGGDVCDAMARIRMLAPGDYYDYNFSRTITTTLSAGTYYLAVDMGWRVVPAGQFSTF